MKFYSRNWYYIGGILFVIMSFVMGFFGDGVSQIEKILIFSFMSLLVHQFEEYGLPGGFPAFFNVIMNGEKEAPDRYPQNSQLAMVVNVVLAYPFYMAAIIAMIAAAVIIVALPIKLFSSRQAKYPFSQEEMERFGMSEKAKRLSEPMRVQKK